MKMILRVVNGLVKKLMNPHNFTTWRFGFVKTSSKVLLNFLSTKKEEKKKKKMKMILRMIHVFLQCHKHSTADGWWRPSDNMVGWSSRQIIADWCLQTWLWKVQHHETGPSPYLLSQVWTSRSECHRCRNEWWWWRDSQVSQRIVIK